MFLLEPAHTAFDLNWSMFGVRIRVHPMFWAISAIMGFDLLKAGFPLFLLWVACVFFSILVHELGHVFMFRSCGANAHVVLYAFGGLAIPDRHLYNRWQRIAVSFAGPLAQFGILAVLALVLGLSAPERLQSFVGMVLLTVGVHTQLAGPLDLNPFLEEAVFFLLWINLFWALLNLLPIFPLDGGQISRDFMDGIIPGGQGVRVALGISLVLAGILTVHCLMAARGKPLIPFLSSFGSGYSAVMFGMLAVQSFTMLQEHQNPPWRRDG